MVLVVETDIQKASRQNSRIEVVTSGCYHIIVGSILLKHQPHCADIVACMSPIAFGLHIAELDFVRKPELDTRHSISDFPRDELDAAQRTFVIELDPG